MRALFLACTDRLGLSSLDTLDTSAAVFKEILHRCTAIRRRDAINPAWQVLADLADEVLSVDYEIVAAASGMVRRFEALSSRDALHAATMARAGVERILSFDTGFDLLPGLRRVR